MSSCLLILLYIWYSLLNHKTFYFWVLEFFFFFISASQCSVSSILCIHGVVFSPCGWGCEVFPVRQQCRWELRHNRLLILGDSVIRFCLCYWWGTHEEKMKGHEKVYDSSYAINLWWKFILWLTYLGSEVCEQNRKAEETVEDGLYQDPGTDSLLPLWW